MKSCLTTWFLKLKLDASLEEAVRLRTRVLDLRSHGLEECPDFLIKLPSGYLYGLKCLVLQSNTLRDFSLRECHALEKVKALAVDYNKLEHLPFHFRHLKNLTILNVSHNNFSNLRFFHVICQLKNLRILWANASGIHEIPMEIAELTHLRVLGLRRNRIRELPRELTTLTNLRWLTLSSNDIFKLPPDFGNLSSLVHFNIQKNYLERLPEGFIDLQELQYLFLDHNMLVIDNSFESFIRRLPNLKYCTVRYNIRPTSRETTTVGADSRFSFNSTDTTDNQEINRVNMAFGSPASRTFSQLSINALGALTAVSMTHPRDENDNFLGTERPSENGISLSDFQEQISARASPNQHSSRRNADSWGEVRFSQTEETTTISNNDAESRSRSSTESAINLIRNDNHLEGNNGTRATAEEMGFSWNVGEGTRDQDLEEGDRIPENNLEEETLAQLPFANSSIISIEEAPTPAAEGRLHDDNEIIKSIDERRLSSRFRMTQDWILQHESNSERRLPNNESYERNEDESDLESLLLSVTDSEDTVEIAHNAETIEHPISDAPGTAASARSSASLIYIMHHRKRPQLWSLNSSASFTPSRTVSTSAIVSPSVVDIRSTSAQSHINIRMTQSLDIQPNTPTIENATHEGTESELFSVASSEDHRNRTERVTSNLGADEMSNYDPSDWERSTPSSAIDDQDIIARYAELQGEGAQHNDGEYYLPLNWLDWRKVLLPIITFT